MRASLISTNAKNNIFTRIETLSELSVRLLIILARPVSHFGLFQAFLKFLDDLIFLFKKRVNRSLGLFWLFLITFDSAFIYHIEYVFSASDMWSDNYFIAKQKDLIFMIYCYDIPSYDLNMHVWSETKGLNWL